MEWLQCLSAVHIVRWLCVGSRFWRRSKTATTNQMGRSNLLSQHTSTFLLCRSLPFSISSASTQCRLGWKPGLLERGRSSNLWYLQEFHEGSLRVASFSSASDSQGCLSQALKFQARFFVFGGVTVLAVCTTDADRYGEDFAFEGCAGHNGRNWLVAPAAEETVKLLQCVRQSLARRMLKWRPSAATFGAGWRSLDSWRRAWCIEHCR